MIWIYYFPSMTLMHSKISFLWIRPQSQRWQRWRRNIFRSPWVTNRSRWLLANDLQLGDTSLSFALIVRGYMNEFQILMNSFSFAATSYKEARVSVTKIQLDYSLNLHWTPLSSLNTYLVPIFHQLLARSHSLNPQEQWERRMKSGSIVSPCCSTSYLHYP